MSLDPLTRKSPLRSIAHTGPSWLISILQKIQQLSAELSIRAYGNPQHLLRLSTCMFDGPLMLRMNATPIYTLGNGTVAKQCFAWSDVTMTSAKRTQFQTVTYITRCFTFSSRRLRYRSCTSFKDLWNRSVMVNALQSVHICKFLTLRTYLFEDTKAKIENRAKNYETYILSLVHLIARKKTFSILKDLFRLIRSHRE